MNPFVAEHPLVSQPSWFNAKAYPVLSLFCSTLVLGFVLTPFLFGWVCFVALTDDVGSTDDSPFPQSLTELLVGIGIAFLICLFCALLLVSGFRLALLLFRSNQVKHETPTGARTGHA